MMYVVLVMQLVKAGKAQCGLVVLLRCKKLWDSFVNIQSYWIYYILKYYLPTAEPKVPVHLKALKTFWHCLRMACAVQCHVGCVLVWREIQGIVIDMVYRLTPGGQTASFVTWNRKLRTLSTPTLPYSLVFIHHNRSG